MKSKNWRKLKKLINKPHIFIRDALLKKYPICYNQDDILYQSENSIFLANNNVSAPFKPQYGIDVVYTWVNSYDEKWLRKKNYYLKSTVNYELYALEDSRFSSHNEIYFSLLSVQHYLPWVNKIYIVTDSQCPDIPEALINKVKIIDHNEIIPKDFLPTFNSHVIEAFLYRIPGLLDNFLYFNDDFFVARKIDASHFFKSNNLASLFIGKKKISEMEKKGRQTATLTACINSNKLFKKYFNTTFEHTLTHTYVPLKKHYYELAFKIFEDEIWKFSVNKFRGGSDLNMATFLVPYLQYLHGASNPEVDICYYFNIRSPSAESYYNALLSAKKNHHLPHSFCANDFSSTEFSCKGYEKKLIEFLNEFFK